MTDKPLDVAKIDPDGIAPMLHIFSIPVLMLMIENLKFHQEEISEDISTEQGYKDDVAIWLSTSDRVLIEKMDD